MALLGAIRKAQLALALVLALAQLLALAQPAYTLMGGWFPATNNVHTAHVLEQALAEVGGGGSRLCYHQVDAVQQQLVNGINFRYSMKGCTLSGGQRAGGRCPTDACESPQPFQVDVFCQPWTNTARVLSVARG